MFFIFFLAGGSVLVSLCALLWQLVGRPVAVACGVIEMTNYDYVVLAWKAEREERWFDALQAYDDGLALDSSHQETRQRRDALIDAHPELIA